MIIDASVVIDAVADPGARGIAARTALGAQPAGEVLSAPGHFAVEVLSGLRAAANRPTHPLQPGEVAAALVEAEGLGITIEATPWVDVHRAWALSHGSMRYPDALYIAAAERAATTLLTADARIARSGAQIFCAITTLAPQIDPS